MSPGLAAGGVRALLELERDCCARMLPILDAERAAAAGYDHVALLACLHEREALQAEWERIARKRRAHLEAAHTPFAVLVAGDADLAAIAAETRREVERVRAAQRINEAIIQATLAHVTDTLTVLRRGLPDSRYDGRAALRAPVPAAGRWSA